LGAWLTLSESTPTVTPAPVTPNWVRARSASRTRSAWLSAIPCVRVIGRYVGVMPKVWASAATVGNCAIGSRPSTVWVAASVCSTCMPILRNWVTKPPKSPPPRTSTPTPVPSIRIRLAWLETKAPLPPPRRKAWYS
jgi:hypothetical protein